MRWGSKLEIIWFRLGVASNRFSGITSNGILGLFVKYFFGYLFSVSVALSSNKILNINKDLT